MSANPFVPHRLIRGGHMQTLAGMYLPSRFRPEGAVTHRVRLPDGDVVVLHENSPDASSTTLPAVLLMHGLAGCHQSPYLQRIAKKLNDRGYRAFRMDLRGCGAGKGLARLPYHAGRSDDVRAVIEFISHELKCSDIVIVGFSLSGNVVLKLAGETPERHPESLRGVVSVNPPIDLARCVARLATPINRIYDRFFTKELYQQIIWTAAHVADAPQVPFARTPSGLWEFDEYYTAPVSGYGNAERYYRECSAAQFLSAIRLPTLILTSADDPLVPVESFQEAEQSPAVTLHVADSGGHLGYIGRRNSDEDCRWMDWRIIEWIERLDASTATSPVPIRRGDA